MMVWVDNIKPKIVPVRQFEMLLVESTRRKGRPSKTLSEALMDELRV